MVPSVSGPKRPHDRVAVSEFKEDFTQCLNNKVCVGVCVRTSYVRELDLVLCFTIQVGFKGYQIAPSRLTDVSNFEYQGTEYSLSHGRLHLCVCVCVVLSCIVYHVGTGHRSSTNMKMLKQFLISYLGGGD